jgi:hypothetical protein
MLAAAMSMGAGRGAIFRADCGGAGDDLVAIGGDALAMEGGRGDAALADVDGVVGGDEAFAEEDLHAADGALFDEAEAWLTRISRMYSGSLTKTMGVPMKR